MTIEIFETRKSWIWFDAYGEPAAADGFAGRMSRQSGYAGLLAEAAAGTGPLSLPWPTGSGAFNNFWRRYLEGTPGEVGATSAWRHLMPLRVAVATDGAPDGATDGDMPRVAATALPCDRLTLEAFLHPHGMGLVATVYLRQPLGLAQTTTRVRECFETVAFTLMAGGRSDGPYKLSLLAEPLLDRLRAWAGGPARAEHRSGPFSIATLVNGATGDGEQEVAEDSPVHRALEGLCTGDRLWAQTPARPLEGSTLETQRGPEQHLLLASEHGRAVWFPWSFTRSASRRSSLGCYHRNLVLLSLQVEGLLGLVELAADDLTVQGRVRSGRMEDLTRLAAQHLGRLYGGADSTYRSASAPAQIDAGGRKAKVDDVRRLLGIGPALHR